MKSLHSPESALTVISDEILWHSPESALTVISDDILWHSPELVHCTIIMIGGYMIWVCGTNECYNRLHHITRSEEELFCH